LKESCFSFRHPLIVFHSFNKFISGHDVTAESTFLLIDIFSSFLGFPFLGIMRRSYASLYKIFLMPERKLNVVYVVGWFMW
jgi:hypothetical protein